MGRVTKIRGLPPDKIKLCLIALSPIDSKTNPITSGAKGKSYFLIKYPITPKRSINPSSK